MNNNNITDLNEYKNQNLQAEVVEEFSDEMVQAYIDAAGMDTPDLWNKIDAGFESECATIRVEKQQKKQVRKKVRKKVTGIVAAAVLLTVIAIPVMALMGNSKGEKEKSIDYEDMIYDEEEQYEQSTDDQLASDSVMEDEAMEEFDGSTPTEESPNDASEPTDNSVTGEIGSDQSEIIPSVPEDVTDERQILVEGKFEPSENDGCIFVIEYIISNEYTDESIEVGDQIILSNPEEMMSLDISWGRLPASAGFDSLYVDENGEYVARLSDFQWIE